ncbi:MAG: hypothetical protein WBA10_09530 [Elainellaceae cyanobacterium]
MFDLSPGDLDASILGCGDGPASFSAEMTALGRSVVSVDPIYQFSADEIRQRVQQTYDPIVSQLKQSSHRYVWETIPDADALGQSRLAAMERFLLDYGRGKAEARYRYQSLPHLELANDQFDLCLCSHLMFLYSEQLSLDFHLASSLELLRIAPDVRIFPLLTLDGELSPYLKPVCAELSRNGFDVQVKSVAYEFQRGGNQMLHVSRNGSAA